MADLRIVDAPVLLQESITDDVKMPTGGLGNYAVRLGDLVWYVVAKENLASKSYVDTASQGVKDKLDVHVADKNNPHQVTKVQVGLGNVDNTADIDKPVSNAVSSAIITATTDMATKAYVNQKDNLKADKATTLSGYGIADAYTKDETYSKIDIDNTLVLKADVAYVDGKDGDLTTLTTNDKTNLVKAINEVYSNIGSMGVLNSLTSTTLTTSLGNGTSSSLDIKPAVESVISDGIMSKYISYKNRTQADKNADVVHIKDYGAQCDGITDDTTAFKNAVVDATNKKTSLLLSGTVYVKDTINVTCDIVGQNATIVTDGSSTFNALLVDSKQHLNIDNIKFVKKGTSIKRGIAVKITGNAANVAVTNIDADSYNSAVVLLSDADATVNTIYKFIVSKTATSGSFKIGFVDPTSLGQTIWTAVIAYNATLAQIQNAIDAAIGSGNSVVTQDSDTMYRIEFIGAWAGLPVASPQFHMNLSGAVQSGSWITLVQKGGAKYLRNITLDRCVAKNSGEYGFNLGHVDNALINNCESYFAYYDGVKFTKHVKNTRIIGGNYCYNGLSFLETGTNQRNGDGIDMYAGGEQVKVIGANCSFNSGLGVQLKNDDNTDLTGYARGKLGMCRDVEFIGMTAENNNIGGISITVNKSANTSYSVTDVTITGGRYNKNGMFGIAVSGGQRIILNSTNTNKNGSVGISVYAASKYVDINNCTSNANGGGTGTGNGLIIAGKNVTVNFGNYCGVDTDALNFDTDLSTLTKHHLANIRVDDTASDVFINLPNERYNSSGRGIQVVGKPTNIKIWQKPSEALVAGSNLIYGSVGSLLFKQDATQAADHLAIKVSGAVDEVGAWRKIGGDTVAEYYTDTVLTGNANVIVARAASADITLTLPLVANQVGMQYTFTKITKNSTYKVKIAAQGTDTINGSTTLPVSLVDYMDSVILIGTSTGWLVLRKVGANITGV